MTLDARTAPVVSSARPAEANPFAMPPLVPRIGDPFGWEEDRPALEVRRALSLLACLSALLAAAGVVGGMLLLD
jgi:hypothetical protein